MHIIQFEKQNTVINYIWNNSWSLVLLLQQMCKMLLRTEVFDLCLFQCLWCVRPSVFQLKQTRHTLGLSLVCETGDTCFNEDWAGYVSTFRCPMTNLCTKWFHREVLNTDRWPKSCCNHPACDYRQTNTWTFTLLIFASRWSSQFWMLVCFIFIFFAFYRKTLRKLS